MAAEKKKVFIVEDDSNTRESMAQYLKLEGFAVKSFSTAQEALLHMGGNMKDPGRELTNLPDALITDNSRHAQYDGLDLLRAVKPSIDTGAKMVRIVQTGNYLDIDIANVIAAGGKETHLLHKPYDLDDMVKVIKEELGMPGTQGHPPR